MPHYIDKTVMQELQDEFAAEFDVTSSHRFRSGDDMQYAFSYMYWLIHAKRQITFDEAFAEYVDTDGDNYLTWNELRTLAAFIDGTPLKPTAVGDLRDRLCKEALKMKKKWTKKCGD